MKGRMTMIEKVNIEKQLTVRELRILMNLSQKNFAKLVGIPYSTYVKKEQGHSRFLACEIDSIIQKTGIPYEKIKK